MYYTIFAKREENFLAKIDVAPLAGARIEIQKQLFRLPYREWSLPSRERGLKLIPNKTRSNRPQVAPLAGARIEMPKKGTDGITQKVAPLAGARIEIS